MTTWAGPVRPRRVRPSLWFLLGFSLVAFFGSSDVRADYQAPCAPGDTAYNSTVTLYRADLGPDSTDLEPDDPAEYAISEVSTGAARMLVCPLAVPYVQAQFPPGTYGTSGSRTNYSVYENTEQNCRITWDYYSGGTYIPYPTPRTITINGSTLPIGTAMCSEAPPECDTNDPQSPLVSFTNVGETAPLSVCDNANGWLSNCTFIAKPGSTTCGPTRCGTVYTWTPETCSAGPTPSEDTDAPAPATKCVTVGDAEYCHDTGQDSQCGWINGHPICLGATPKGGCQEAGGGALCDPAATTPPAPDNGTPGVKATDDGTVKAESGAPGTVNTYNYYNSTTIGGSTVGTVTGNPEQSGDYDGDGFTNPDQEEEYGTFNDPGNEFGEFGDGTGIWGESAWDMGTRTGSMKSFLAGTFPFSLIAAGPLTMSYGGAMPTISYTASGHTASSSLSMWADLFTLFRACMSVLLIWGFWLVMIETVKGWSK